MMDANNEILGCITGRPPMGDDKKLTRDIIAHIERMTKRGVKVKYLMPKFPDRLHLGYQYMKAGAEVTFSSCLMVHNIRFIIVDDSIVVIGIPESTGEKEATRKGYRIPSAGLAVVLRNYFDNCEDPIGFTDYLKEVMKLTGATPEHIAREYEIEEDELRKFAG
jgi:hypothetical protein